jgi:hypothetical protein
VNTIADTFTAALGALSHSAVWIGFGLAVAFTVLVPYATRGRS